MQTRVSQIEVGPLPEFQFKPPCLVGTQAGSKIKFTQGPGGHMLEDAML